MAGNAEDARTMREARERLLMSQERMGQYLGISQRTVSDVERELSPLHPLARRAIARLLTEEEAMELSGQPRPCRDRPDTVQDLAEHMDTCPACMAAALNTLKR